MQYRQDLLICLTFGKSDTKKASRSRGCTVDVKVGNLKTTVGFVIRPAAEGGSGFEVAMVPADFVQTQYGGERDSESLGAPI